MYVILKDRAIIEVTGDDSLKFLQNLTTNDLASNDYSYNYILNNQGRYLFDFFAFKESNKRFLLDINENLANSFIQKLNFYKLRSKIEINDLSKEYKVVYSKNNLNHNSVFSFQDPRFAELGIRSLFKIKDIMEGQYSDSELYLLDKYNFTIIDGFEDLILEKSIIIEYGAKELNSISYIKGCYIGQEVIARATYQGVIRKKIFKLSSKDDLSKLKKDSEIIANCEKIGILCSSYKNSAIALVREEKYLELNARKEVIIKDIDTGLEIIANLLIPDWRK